MKPELSTRESHPYNAEPEPPQLVLHDITPVSKFYVRNHGEIPNLTEDDYRLELGGLDDPNDSITLRDLKREYPNVSTVTTLQCAGNRRSEFPESEGTPWQACAVGTASWRGVLLESVLHHRVVRAQDPHLVMTGNDLTEIDSETVRYECSVPLADALKHGALLAWEMNEEPLTPEHGFPLRMVIPGLIGARSVKWLKSIRFSQTPSTNPHFTKAYKMAPPGDDSPKWTELPPISVSHLNSAICEPVAQAELLPGAHRLRGYAVPRGDGNVVISRVEVQVNDGPWKSARLTSEPRPYCWSLWEYETELEEGEHLLRVRAWDSSGRLQQKKPMQNPKGYLYSGWHSLAVKVGTVT